MNQTPEPSTLVKQAKQLLLDMPVEKHQQKLKKLRQETLQPNFWDKADAQSIMQEVSWLENKINQADQINQLQKDLQASLELMQEAQEAKAQQQLTEETKNLSEKLSEMISELRLDKYLSGRYDRQGAILSIHPGQGGTEAMDWASMLQRMYQRYFERRDWKYNLITETPGEEAGIKEAVYEVGKNIDKDVIVVI